MKPLCRRAALLVVGTIVSACSLFDSGVEWRAGPYALVWIDTAENVSLDYDLGDGAWVGRIDSTVFAVGWDGRYLVAKQHPGNDRSKTNYFIIDAGKDGRYADTAQAVTGPLTAAQFQRRYLELKLPAFSKVLDSLQ